MSNADNIIRISTMDELDYNCISSADMAYSTIDALTTDQISSFNIGTINSINYSTTASPYTFSSGLGYGGLTSASPLKVTGTAEFDGDIKWKGRSLGDMIEKIEKRLSILTPDPDKLKHFEALQKAYDHYKMLEKLCELPEAKDGE